MESLTRRLKYLVAYRLVFTTALLGSFIFFEIGHNAFPYTEYIFKLVVFLYAVNIVYLAVLNRVKPLVLAYVQFLIDVLSVISLIFFTGGIESWFSFILPLVVIAASIVLNRRAGFVTAILGSILYGVMLDLQYYGLIRLPYSPAFQEKDFLYNIFSHFLALFLSAYLMGYLSSRLESTTESYEQKVIDYRDLSLFNKEVVDNVPSGLLTTDLVGRLLFFDKAAEEITGKMASAIRGEDIRNIFHFLQDDLEINRTDGEIPYGQSRRVVGLTVTKLRNSEGVHTGYIGIFKDLTEVKRMQEEMRRQEKWAMIGEMSANMAHEIRNPLASLRGSVDMLKNSSLTTEQKNSLMEIALSEMDRLNRIITDFLSYSKPTRPEMEHLDLRESLDEMLEVLGAAVPEKVRLDTDFEDEVQIYGDPHRLRQVYLNLALNAFDAMGGEGTLSIRSYKLGKYAGVCFSDTGPGVPYENREKIFFPFFTTKETGTGLGLSIAARIVEDHGGMIRLDSDACEGSAFTVFLPLNGEKTNGRQ